MRISLLLLLLVSLAAVAAAGRDPFAPPSTGQCVTAGRSELGWRLLGVIGRPGHFAAWLLSPQGKALRRQAGEALPATAWQLTATDLSGVTLTLSSDCPPLRLGLKGTQYDKDIMPVAGAD